jgi:starvation-inducible DNA-binding protein
MNTIGIDKIKSDELSIYLNSLLANYQIFYTNVRGFHWNIKGDKFFELHIKFEELYNDLNLKIDEISERILTLGQRPEHRFSDYLKISEITEKEKTSNGIEDVENIVESLRLIISKQRNILTMSGEAEDEGTNSLMSDYIREQEKLVWMYSAFLNKKN